MLRFAFSSPVLCFSPELRFAQALFMVFRLESLDPSGAKECTRDRSCQEFSNEYLELLFFNYFVAKFGFDTALSFSQVSEENSPVPSVFEERSGIPSFLPSESKFSKVCQKAVSQLHRSS